jgi:hypothetical protein
MYSFKSLLLKGRAGFAADFIQKGVELLENLFSLIQCKFMKYYTFPTDTDKDCLVSKGLMLFLKLKLLVD